MRYIKTHGLDVPLFSLGTVQLGMNYGITGDTEKPSAEYSFSMLNRALELGVNMLDTANNYGDSEALIGKWLRTLPRERRPLIVTKIGPFKHGDANALREEIRRQANGCLETLGVDKIDLLMLHNFTDYEASPKIIREEFLRLKELGIAEKIAMSVYSYEDYFAVASSGFDAVQIPISIFDLTRVNDGGIQAIADAGMMIFARSVFLQGLVFMTPDTLDPRMSFAKEPLRRFHALSEEFGLPPAALAASFVLSLPGITSLVLGCQRIPQIEENCRLIDEARLFTADEMAKVKEAFSEVDPVLINPRLWYNK
ncbi:MAG: aldo/keto reductase [Clostridia bacterium]|nr:aldo/keto reductase [Clostridia bacterium]